MRSQPRLTVALSMLLIGIALAGCSRDEGSYQYGRSTLSTDARMLWNAALQVPGSTVHSIEDACRISMDAAMHVDSPQAESMRKMDTDDMLGGCVDAVGG
jgi:hypothetical protein